MRALPPLQALRAFEAVARHGGLVEAAAELGVTPSALSHRLRGLEAELGVRLMRRRGRQLEPTAAGARLLPGLAQGFRSIADAVALVRRDADEAPLTIALRQSFAVHWLLPQLPDFERAHPPIQVRLVLSERPPDFTADEIDIAVDHGDGPWPGLRVDLLFRDALLPVASAQLLLHGAQLKQPADILKHTLLVARSRPQAWPAWLAAAGLAAPGQAELPRDVRRQELDNTNLALQAAARGLGIAIAGRRLVRSLIEARWLLAPFALTVPDRHAYHIVSPDLWASRPKIKAMRTWLLDRAGRDGEGERNA